MQSVHIGVIGAGVIGGAHSGVLRQIGPALGGTVELVAAGRRGRGEKL